MVLVALCFLFLVTVSPACTNRESGEKSADLEPEPAVAVTTTPTEEDHVVAATSSINRPTAAEGDPINRSFLIEITERIEYSSPAAWPDGNFSLPEITGGGVALFDYDLDGDLDLLQTRQPPPGEQDMPAHNRLFRQSDAGAFHEVTRESGLGDPGFGQGIAIGDIDNDGDADVYFTNYGLDTFYLNNGDGTFRESTADVGFAGNHWSVSASFLDYDRDGFLDLFVAHYIEFAPDHPCQGLDDVPDYCGPQEFPPSLDTLYHNDGDGTFTDVTSESGIQAGGSGLGVVAADFTADEWPDIYVANDGNPNQLWVNRTDGTFEDEAMIRGVALNGRCPHHS